MTPEAIAQSKSYDEDFTWGHRPTVAAPFPFTPTQYGHLLVLRGRIEDGLFGSEDMHSEDAAA